jgi:hypothetical protein
MKFYLTFLLICLGVPACLDAQDIRQVTGKVWDSANSPLPRASVKLFFPGRKDTLQMTTDSSGRFHFAPVDTNKFTIAISNIGFIDFRRFYSFPAEMKDLNLNSIIMQRDVKVLEEVVIGVPPIQIKEDTVEYKADSFKVKPNSMVEDLLKKLPGVQVDKNGNVTAQGKQVTKVRVNGKDFFGGDVQTATRELPADIVDKVQVIDDYGDQAAVSGIKDGDPDKVINLQLKKDKNKGAFGRATAGYGTDDRYTGTINANMFSDRSQLSLFGNANNTNNSLFNIGGPPAEAGGERGEVVAPILKRAREQEPSSQQEPVPWELVTIIKATQTRMVSILLIQLGQTIERISVSGILSMAAIVLPGETVWEIQMYRSRIFLRTRLS